MQRFKIYILLFLSVVLVSGGTQYATQYVFETLDLSSKDPAKKASKEESQNESGDPVKKLMVQIATLNTPAHVADAECDGKWPCNQAKPDLRYESCDPAAKNSYMEKALSESRENFNIMKLITPAHESDATDQTQYISRQCVRQAMDMAFYSNRNKSSFKSCSSASAAPHKSIRPCISNNYFDSINNGFNLVSQCMKDYVLPGADTASQKQLVYSMFKMITMESGFHMNVFSNSGAGGLGQMTSGAIKDVNDKQRASLIQKLTSSDSDEKCQNMAKELLVNKPPMKSSEKNACERISPAAGSPLLNLIYTYAYFKQTRQAIQKVTNDKRYSQLFSLPTAEKEMLVSELATWSHNTGAAGMTKPLIALLNEYHMNGRKVTDAKKFLQELEGIAYRMPHKANSSPARRKETSQYYRKMQSYVKTIEKDLGGQSCLRD